MNFGALSFAGRYPGHCGGSATLFQAGFSPRLVPISPLIQPAAGAYREKCTVVSDLKQMVFQRVRSSIG